MTILVVLSRVPYPLEKGDKLRAYHQIKQLSKKHKIILFAINDQKLDAGAMDELKKYCHGIHIVKFSWRLIFFNLLRTVFAKIPFQVGYFYHNKAQEKLNQLVNRYRPDCIYFQLIRTAQYAREIPHPVKVLDYMDAFSKGVERRMRTASFYLKPILNIEYKRLLHYEKEVYPYFKHHTIISEQDKNSIEIVDKSKIKVVPNGVDVDFFVPTVEEKKEFDLLFNGNMSYEPNVEAVEYLINKILPIIIAQKPDVKVLISGTSPAKRVKKLASQHVVVSGWVKDIRENFAKSKILIAPMQSSIGLQNKLLEAMAMKIPCVTSTLSNNALCAEVGKEILVADTPEQYAQHILFLLNNPEKAQQMAQNGYEFILKKYNWKTSTATLEELLK